ncbi:thioredoxin family protein [Noviherbaspirillum humi]
MTLTPASRHQLSEWLTQGDWVVACLCAAWCDTCRAYRTGFDALAAQHPGRHFVWIDIEDEADVVGDFDVENFPTLLIQQGDQVSFYGTVLPDHKLAQRLIDAQLAMSAAELARAASTLDPEVNLLTRLNDLA